jgi:hypothetical protein
LFVLSRPLNRWKRRVAGHLLLNLDWGDRCYKNILDRLLTKGWLIDDSTLEILNLSPFLHRINFHFNFIFTRLCTAHFSFRRCLFLRLVNFIHSLMGLVPLFQDELRLCPRHVAAQRIYALHVILEVVHKRN